MPRPVRSHAVADLEYRSPTPPTPPVREKQTRTANDTESDGDGSPDTHLTPPRPKRGRLAAEVGEEPIIRAARAAGMETPKAITVRGKVLPPRSPQPARTNRNTHPGMVAMPRAKRTSAEVNAFAKNKANLRQRAEVLERQRIEALAEIELQEELEEEAEARSVIKGLGDASFIDDVEMRSESSDDKNTDETSSKVASEDDSGSDRSVVKRKAAPKARKMQKKAKRGEVRAATDRVKDSLKAAGKKRQTASLSDNRKKTGLVSNWQSMVPAVSRGSSKAGSSKAKSGTSGNPSALGGLDDEDAVATPLKNAGRYRRKNDTVAIESVSESDTDAKTSKPFRKSVKRTAALDHKVKPNFPKSKSHSTSMKDLKAKLERASVVPSESPTSTDLSGSLAMGSDTTGLPDFARSAWSTSFLPTLYSRLGSSSNPFVLGADMVQVIQEVVNLVYPNSDYQVRVNDRIFTLAKDRLNDKRTFFGRQGIKVVTEFFRDEGYVGKPKATAKYALWATRGDGPAIFGVPTPYDCVATKGDAGYIKPEDIFESKFILQLLTPFLKWCRGSCHDYGHPIGALALAATGVERAFMMHTTGVPVPCGQFSREVIGTVIGEYIYTASKLSNRRWEKIKSLCGAEQKPSLKSQVYLDRRAMYEPSSPLKPDGLNEADDSE